MLDHDFAVYGADGRLDLIVEARASRTPSMGWAIHARLLATAKILPVSVDTPREAERLRVDTKRLLPTP